MTITAGKSASVPCSVASIGGFAGTVRVVCQNPPFHCSLDRASVDVTPGSSATVTATIPVPGDWGAGAADQRVQANSGTLAHPATIHVEVATFRLACSPPNGYASPGQSTDAATCDATSLNGWTGTVAFSCSQLPAGASCVFSPPSATVPSGQAAATSFRVQVDQSVPPGRYFITVSGVSDAIVQSVTHEVDVG